MTKSARPTAISQNFIACAAALFFNIEPAHADNSSEEMDGEFPCETFENCTGLLPQRELERLTDETGPYLIEHVFFGPELFLPSDLQTLQTPTLKFNMECWVLFSAADQMFPDEAQKTTLDFPSAISVESFFSYQVMEELTHLGLNMLYTDNIAALQGVKNGRVLERSMPFQRLETHPFPNANSVEIPFAPVEVIMAMSQLSECEQFAMKKLRP